MWKKTKNFILSALFAVSATPAFIPAYSFTGPTSMDDGATSGFDATDVIASGVNALNTLTGKMTAVSLALFPLALILICVILAITHDAKKVAGLIWSLGIICVATFIVILANNGTALELIKQLASFITAAG